MPQAVTPGAQGIGPRRVGQIGVHREGELQAGRRDLNSWQLDLGDGASRSVEFTDIANGEVHPRDRERLSPGREP